jgi:hypothetical protein
MIIDKGLTVGEVITVKFTSGEEVLATLVEERTDYIKVSKPRALTATEGGIGMVPFVFTIDPTRDIKLYRTTIIVAEPAEKEYAASYTKATSGIIV